MVFEIALGRVIGKLPTALRFDSHPLSARNTTWQRISDGLVRCRPRRPRARGRLHEPSCHAVANALEGALDAELGAIRDGERESPDLTGIPDPPVSNILIANPGTEN